MRAMSLRRFLLEQLGPELTGMRGSENENATTKDLENDGDFSVAEELAVLARKSFILERRGELCDGIRKFFSSCQRALQVEKIGVVKQTTVYDHFC